MLPLFEFKTFLFENDFTPLFPEIFLLLCTISLLVYGSFCTTSRSFSYPLATGNLFWLAQLALFFTFVLLCKSPLQHGVLFYNTLIHDHFTFFLKVLVVCGSWASISIGMDYIKREAANGFELVILVLLSVCSMFFLISSLDLISVYLAIELQTLCFYVMAALKRNSEFSTEAGLKYFLLGAFSSGLFLFGCSLVYGFTGQTNLLELAKIFNCGGEQLALAPSSLRGCELGLIFLVVAFLFKITAVPFHMWAPDVYEGAPTAVTAFFSIAPKISFLAVFSRVVLETFFDFMVPWQKILLFSSLASMVVASLAALSQNKMKRLLAWSSIGHVGYMLVGLCCGSLEGLQGFILYLVVYIVMTVSLFAIALLPLRRDFMDKVNRIKYTTDLAQYSQNNPLIAVTIAVTLFSIAGIPPLAGFYSKAFLFFAALSSTQYLLAIAGVLTTVVSCFYYIRIVKIIYFEPARDWWSFPRVSKETSYVLGITFLFILGLIAYPGPLYLATHKVALSLCA